MWLIPGWRKGVSECERRRQMAEELKTMTERERERDGRGGLGWGAQARRPTGGNCSVAGVWQTSASQSATPSLPGP